MLEISHTKVLSIDIGTSSVKAALFSEEIVMLGKETFPLSYSQHASPSLSCVEEWATTLQKISKIFSAMLPRHKNEHCIIVISSHAPSSVYLNVEQKPLYYIPWYSNQYVSLAQEHSHYLPQIKYVQDALPEIFEQVHYICSPAEYLSLLLTGEHYAFIPYPEMASWLYNVGAFSLHQIPKHLVGKSIYSGTYISFAKSAFAHSIGLQNCIVVAGGVDFHSSLLGAGIVDDSIYFQRSGTSVVLNHLTDINLQILYEDTHTSDTPNIFLQPAETRTFEKKYTIVGHKVPLYNEIFNHLSKNSDVFSKEYSDLISILTSHRSALHLHITHIHDIISNQNHISMQDILRYLATQSPAELSNYILLVQLIETISTIKNQAETRTLSNNNPMIVSGGHAYNHVLMQLQASYLGCKISVFDPAHTELIGNLIYAYRALERQLEKNPKLTHKEAYENQQKKSYLTSKRHEQSIRKHFTEKNFFPRHKFEKPKKLSK